jgi:2,3-bisphosphoglycerate-independent phosphoglycerate mutase
MKKPNVLMILDGWGYSEKKDYNAISLANTNNLDFFIKKYPGTFLSCSGLDVGLPYGFMGNSEVGHLNIGAGRIVYQDLTRINKVIEDGSFFKNKNLIKALNIAKEKKSRVHLMGLLSDGGVHSMIDHLDAFLAFFKKNDFSDVIIHPIFDGRDTEPMAGKKYLETLYSYFKKYGLGKIGTLSGRYYTMDRDKRWERIKKTYDVLVNKKPLKDLDPISYIEESHKKGVGDEFIEPVCLDEKLSIEDNDVVIFYNFRSDRARQITKVLTNKKIKEFNREKFPNISYFLCMTEYDETYNLDLMFEKQKLKNTMGEVISNNNLKQLRIAETEKYAHVTFFFNGGVEKEFKNEDRILVNSPKDVATYDLKPEMSANEVTEKLLKVLDNNTYDFIVINYANCDMVGHTGKLDATIKAVETVDKCSKKIIDKVLSLEGRVFLTADHGNAEKMIYKNQPHTAHTTSKVRFLTIAKDLKQSNIILREGILADIMPTILDCMKIDIPKEVIGKTLFER